MKTAQTTQIPWAPVLIGALLWLAALSPALATDLAISPSSASGTVAGIAYRNEDLLLCHLLASGPYTSCQWSMLFDGSDVGLNADIEAVDVLPDGTFVMRLPGVTLPGLGSVQGKDLVRFVPTSLGENTAGTWELFFDASRVGDTRRWDAVDVAPDGSLLLSVPANGGGPFHGFTIRNEDIVRCEPTAFDPTTGAITSCSWSLFFDSGVVGVTGNIKSIELLPDGSLLAQVSGPGVPANEPARDLVRYVGTFGTSPSGTWSFYFDGSDVGLAGKGIDAVATMPETCQARDPGPPPPAPALARRCQKAIARAGAAYLKRAHAAMSRCLDKIAAGKLAGNPTLLCRGTQSTPPTDTHTAEAMARAEARARRRILAGCTDAQVAALATCASPATAAGAADCTIATHRELARSLTIDEYGFALALPADRAARRCQKAVGRAGRSYAARRLGAEQRCLGKVNRGALPGPGDTRCLGAFDGTSFTQPADARTARTIARAEARLRGAIARRCTDGTLAPLAPCGATTVAELEDCLLCTHFARVSDAIRAEYGGSPSGAFLAPHAGGGALF